MMLHRVPLFFEGFSTLVLEVCLTGDALLAKTFFILPLQSCLFFLKFLPLNFCV